MEVGWTKQLFAIFNWRLERIRAPLLLALSKSYQASKSKLEQEREPQLSYHRKCCKQSISIIFYLQFKAQSKTLSLHILPILFFSSTNSSYHWLFSPLIFYCHKIRLCLCDLVSMGVMRIERLVFIQNLNIDLKKI